MNLDVTQKNLYLFIPSKVSHMVGMLMDDEKVGTIEALRNIYSSRTYGELEDESTKKWQLGPVALYEEIKND